MSKVRLPDAKNLKSLKMAQTWLDLIYRKRSRHLRQAMSSHVYAKPQAMQK